MRDQKAAHEVVCNLDGHGSSGTEPCGHPMQLEASKREKSTYRSGDTRHESIKSILMDDCKDMSGNSFTTMLVAHSMDLLGGQPVWCWEQMFLFQPAAKILHLRFDPSCLDQNLWYFGLFKIRADRIPRRHMWSIPSDSEEIMLLIGRFRPQ